MRADGITSDAMGNRPLPTVLRRSAAEADLRNASCRKKILKNINFFQKRY